MQPLWRHQVDTILTQTKLHPYFNSSICGDKVTLGKPNPEIFLKACEKLNVQPSEVLVLEDSEAGIQAAYDGGMKVICIPDMRVRTLILSVFFWILLLICYLFRLKYNC